MLITEVKVTPVYPPEATASHKSGQVVVNVTISESGDVTKADVASGDSTFGESALAAAREWKFAPYFKNGKAVAVNTQIPFDFHEEPSSEPDPPGRASSTATPIWTCVTEYPKTPAHCPAIKLSHRVTPEYPANAKRNGEQGTVRLHVFADESGTVIRVTAISGPKELVESSIEAVKQWRYEPLLVEGHPARIEALVETNFWMQ